MVKAVLPPKGQTSLPFRKIVLTAHGKHVAVAPEDGPRDTPFICELCKLSFKTKQAQQGHVLTNKTHAKLLKQQVKQSTGAR